MRYEDWDILLFPDDRRVPIKEFKVACHVVHDADQPTVSQFTKSYTKYLDSVKFEARLFIDGRLITSTWFDRKTLWPHLITQSLEFSKNGDLEPLKFPNFRQEVLQQSHWSPADYVGRISVIISEGFPRDSLSMPLERVKNIVAFSFQHAPLDILESSAIAWPNPSMWRRAPFTASMAVPTYSSEDTESHAHSPRCRVDQKDVPSGYDGQTIQNIVANEPVFSSHDHGQQFQLGGGDLALSSARISDHIAGFTTGFDWIGNAGALAGTVTYPAEFPRRDNAFRKCHKSSTDTSMPDYVSIPNQGSQDDGHADSQLAEESLQNFQGYDGGRMNSMKVPANTPTSGGSSAGALESKDILFPFTHHSASLPPELATTLTNSLLNQSLPIKPRQTGHIPALEVKSREEERYQSQADPSPSTLSSTSTCENESHDVRKVSQKIRIPTGASLPAGTVPSQFNSPQLVGSRGGYETGHRKASRGDIGADVTNESTPEAALRIISGNSDKGTKRTRNFTPVSAKVIDEEDEPRRASPRVRLAAFAERDEPGPIE